MERVLFAVLFACSASTAAAQVTPERLTFPLLPTESFAEKGIACRLEPDLLRELNEAGDLVTLGGVTLPTKEGNALDGSGGLELVSLTLRRQRIVTDDFELWVDGQRRW